MGMADQSKTDGMIHAACGGVVIPDSDFVSGPGGEWWWRYRCTECGETFQTREEFLNDE